MLYTLLKVLGWGALLAFIGGCIGWALRSLKCRAEVARAKAATIDVDEVDRMRHRVANLEQVVAERDRLRIQVADVRHADSPGIVGAVPAEEPEPEPPVQSQSEPDATIAPESDTVAEAEPSEETVAAAGFSAAAADDSTAAEPAADEPTADESAAAEPAVDESDAEPASSPAGDSALLDVDAASAVIGAKIELDDLTVVEGIGPKISELCSGIGISTWRQLADADVADLQSMLDAAGSRYTVHKPGTWPRQAELLATGQWVEFKAMTDELDSGR